MSDTPFTPYTPEAPPVSPAADEPKPRTRKPRARKFEETPPPPEGTVSNPFPPARKKRKPRAVASVRKPRSMKLPVDTMLDALSELKGDDGALFEKLLGILNAAGKPQRARVMAALAKVFE